MEDKNADLKQAIRALILKNPDIISTFLLTGLEEYIGGDDLIAKRLVKEYSEKFAEPDDDKDIENWFSENLDDLTDVCYYFADNEKLLKWETVEL